MRRGTTLIELIIALAVLGIVLSVSTMAFGTLREEKPTPAVAMLNAARVKALRTGIEVRVEFADSLHLAAPKSVLLLPDGRVLGRGFDELTGEATNAAR